mmetsp:Transcript_30593/g.64609  ORF Transcript_30593/g.64609 Transcript_30593/m.64609 type:complete len:125 (+) Transcript_30593:2264-2638(+)
MERIAFGAMDFFTEDGDDDDDCDVELFLSHAKLAGKATKKSDEAAMPFVGGGIKLETASNNGSSGMEESEVRRRVCDDDEEEDGTMTITSSAVPVEEPKGEDEGGGDDNMIDEAIFSTIVTVAL